jgi:outer membrane protein OmpA-like peptidoglycan-associated protein
MSKNYARPLVNLAFIAVLATAASGCQTMSDLDPTGLLAEDEVAESQFPIDSQQQAEADANTTTPDLAGIPTRPAAPDTLAQADGAQSLAAAGAQAQYSAEALRAGTEASAPPPVASDANAARQALAATEAPPTTFAGDVPPSAGLSDAPPSAAPPSAAPPVAMASAAPPPSADPIPAPAPAPVASAPVAPPPGAEPAVPAVPMTAAGRMAMINPSDAQLGFKPSSAPPLNSSISQWVSPPILAHYRQTAALAGSAGTGAPAVPAVPSKGVGGAAMTGDVIANLDAVPGTPAGMAAAMNGGIPPTATIYFAGDGTSLPASARTQLRGAVAAFQAGGGNGTIKVIGHASSRTPNMPVERHLEVIFQKSQARANAVAQALIRAGVPANRVIVEAVGDSQPIYYESMPRGEAGNRRAEIFVQG